MDYKSSFSKTLSKKIQKSPEKLLTNNLQGAILLLSIKKRHEIQTTRTVKGLVKMKTLQELLKQTKGAKKEGIFGIDACKESIRSTIELDAKQGKKTSLYTLLEEYVDRANKDIFFNSNMVQACWQLINEVGEVR